MKSIISRDDGEVMLEAVFGITVTIIVLAMLLSLGFYLYQRTMVGIVANDIAEEVVLTYKYKNVSDATEITLSDVQGVSKYRYSLFGSSHRKANQTKADNLLEKELDLTSLVSEKYKPKVSIKEISDDVGRSHFEVTVTASYNIVLQELMNSMGMNLPMTISSTVRVEKVDVSNYVNTVKMTNYLMKKATGAVPILNTVDKVIGLMKSVYNIFH